MDKNTTRIKQYTENDSNLYFALELGGPNWKLAFSIGLGQNPRLRTIPPRDLEALFREIAAAKKRFHVSESARVFSCYEAGRDGFWLHRCLVSKGIENLIVDSASIEVNRRKRRAKTDRLDAQKLVSMLMRHQGGERKVWSIVHVPTVEEEDRRQMHREREGLKKEIDRTKNRIRGLLATEGIRLEPRMNLSEEKLAAMRIKGSRSPLPARLRSRLKREWEHVIFLKSQLASLEKERREEVQRGEDPDLNKIKRMQTLKGIGEQSSWPVVREFFGWRTFKNRGEVGSLAGLTGTPHDSGDEKRDQGISKAGNRHIRGVMIEIAWSWIRYQPKSALTQWFINRFASGGKVARKIGIVAVARRLLIALWEFIEMGVIPEGAELKANA